MTNRMIIALAALPLALAVSACGNPQEKQAEEVQAATVEQPGLDGQAATPSQARTEALELAQHLSSGHLEPGQAIKVLDDLDKLVSENLVDFPEDIRPALTEDIQSARDALEADDKAAMQEAATQFQKKLAGADSATEAE